LAFTCGDLARIHDLLVLRIKFSSRTILHFIFVNNCNTFSAVRQYVEVVCLM